MYNYTNTNTNTNIRKGIRIAEGYLHKDDPKAYSQPTIIASSWCAWTVYDGSLARYIDKVADVGAPDDVCDVIDFLRRDPLNAVAAGMTDPADIAAIDRYCDASLIGATMYVVHYVDNDCHETDTALYSERPAMYDSDREAVDDYLGTIAREKGIQFRDIDGRRVFYDFYNLFDADNFIGHYGGGISVVADIDRKIICDYPTERNERAAQENGVRLSVEYGLPAFDAGNSHGTYWTTVTTDNTTRDELSERFGGNEKLLRAYDDLTDNQALLIDLDIPGCFDVIPRRPVRIDAPEGSYYIGVVM